MRRWIISLVVALVVVVALVFPQVRGAESLIRVVVWDEQQPQQKQADENFLGNALADHLRQQPGLRVISANLDQPERGIPASLLDNTDVLVWWGHVRQHEITPEIAKGLPATFAVLQTEMYSEPFHVPEPDEVILEQRWEAGEHFRSGCVWRLGAGRVFYFRPGHETYPVFKQELPLQIVTNAVNWLGSGLNKQP